MRKIVRQFKLVILLFLINGFVPAAEAADKRIELTNIKVRSSAEGTIIRVNTSRPVKFLYYKVENPARLIIDFISTNIYSREPEKIVFTRGNLREIQSVFYETEGGQPGLDSLVLKFVPNVTVKVKGEKSGILLRVERSAVFSQAVEPPDKNSEAYILAEKIARRKSLAGRGDKRNHSLLSSLSYMLSLYENSIKKELAVFESRETETSMAGKHLSPETLAILAAAGKTNINLAYRRPDALGSLKLSSGQRLKDGGYLTWAALAATSIITASGALIMLVKGRRRKTNLRQVNVSRLQKSDFSRLRIVERLTCRDNQANRCFEKRQFARLGVPAEGFLRVSMDIETQKLCKAPACAKNISLGGICIEIEGNIEIPRILEIWLRLPDVREANQVLARIEWSRKKDDGLCCYGLSFMMLGEKEEAKIKTFLNDNL
ncbi:MAG: PilZ domain-containing protein [Candidatus Omnitrophica bacterium]|nr:PilZ domain-containing protein [Candidatus Omnitrophota bacterium]